MVGSPINFRPTDCGFFDTVHLSLRRATTEFVARSPFPELLVAAEFTIRQILAAILIASRMSGVRILAFKKEHSNVTTIAETTDTSPLLFTVREAACKRGKFALTKHGDKDDEIV